MTVRIAVLTGSSASGLSCIKKILSSKSDNVIVRGCFRTQEKATTTQASLPTTGDAFESTVGLDAENIDSLIQALDGVDRALLVTPLDYSQGVKKDAQKSINMIKAAQQCGVKRIVHVGSWTVHAPEALPILSSRFVPTEEYLESQVGDEMEWTVLRGGYFSVNFSHVHSARIREYNEMVQVPDCKIPPVDVRDIGEAAAALLVNDDGSRYHGDYIECCGPQLLSHGQIAAELGAGIGRSVRYPESPTLAEWVTENPVMEELYHYMADPASPGVPSDVTKIAEVLGRTPTSLRQWASDHRPLFL